ncbi:MAG: hypothetical protein ABSG60_12945 [Terracidiphilus sp.]|jgi:diadenosine tetraphosphate (Ap4A) HIT family hydrolase
MNGCAFCSNSAFDDSPEDWNQPLLESRNFAVLPSLGALVEGWLLIVPKKHFISVGALPGALWSEFSALKSDVVHLSEELYGPVCVFEHGPSAEKHQVGCGVDHAHLHVVPTALDLTSSVAPFLPIGARWTDANLRNCRDAYERGKDYLYLEDQARRGQMVVHQRLGSQLFRRAIALEIGFDQEFNWREHPQFSNVRSTINTVRHATRSAYMVGSGNAA